VRCETLINCAGQWARQFGALAGVNVPLYSAEHFYIVTDRIEGVHPMLPVMRDPDGFIYYKEEVGGLVMGGFEPVAKPWAVDPIPADFQFQLLGEDWDQFEILMTNAIHRTPCLETAPVKMLLNGPESFTPDGNFILGEAPGLRGYFVCAGFNSAGIANSGGAGQADRRVDGRRRGAATCGTWTSAASAPSPPTAARWPSARRNAGPALRHALAAPGTAPARPAAHRRCTTCWPRAAPSSAARTAGSAPTYFRPAVWTACPRPRPGHARLAAVDAAEQRATREAVALYDQTSFGKLLLQGRDALALLQRLCANEIDVATGPHGLHRDAQRAAAASRAT
jgi:hypothetical protein